MIKSIGSPRVMPAVPQQSDRTGGAGPSPSAQPPVVLAQYQGESRFEGAPTGGRAAALTGELAPGGRFDPTQVGDRTPGSQTLFAESTWGFPSYTQSGHHYAVLSDPLPPGTTWEQANQALQRFNAPTAEALRGVPGDGRSTEGWVALPGTSIPAGRVTFERGDGWVRNTTAFPHPLIGTITRRIIRDDQGQFRVLTEGEGRGGPVGGTRHRMNIQGIPGVAPGGPEIFGRVDQLTIDYLRQQQQQIRP